MDDYSSNPYAAPTELERDSSPGEPLDDRKRPTLHNALLRWTVVCAISAAPSFFCGWLTISNHWIGVPAMVCGVIVFVIAYALIDVGPTWRRWMSKRVTRNCILTGYGLRLFISIAFPIGMVNDMWAGILSISAVGALFGEFGMSNQLSNPIQILLTTLLQGVILNLELLLIISLLVGLTHAFRDLLGMWASSVKE